MTWIKTIYNGEEVFMHKHNKIYTQLIRKIRNRDNNTCQICGITKANKPITEPFLQMHVHHIKTSKDFPELYLEEDNLITLCGVCHSLIHGKHIQPRPRDVVKYRFRQQIERGRTLEDIAMNKDSCLSHVTPELRKHACYILVLRWKQHVDSYYRRLKRL